MKRVGQPWISPNAQDLLVAYQRALQERSDFHRATIRNYLSDLRQFIAWCEGSWQEGVYPQAEFRMTNLTTPLIAHYRAYLLTSLHLKPASVNRMLISIKRFCAWATERDMLASDPACTVQLLQHTEHHSRFLSDAEEYALLEVVATSAPLRDRAIVVTLLRAGLRAHELCALTRDHVYLQPQGGHIVVTGERSPAREIPLDSITHEAFSLYLPTRPTAAIPLFVGNRTHHPLTERTVGRIVHAYASQAQLSDVSPLQLRSRFGYRMAHTLPLPEVARLLGYTALASVMRYCATTDVS